MFIQFNTQIFIDLNKRIYSLNLKRKYSFNFIMGQLNAVDGRDWGQGKSAY